LKPILQETYGVMIYQEQIMMTARVAANFTLGKADMLRRAISKKKEKDLTSMKSDFINGCVKNGYPQQIAESLFALIEKFAGYGFNKSHAVAYGVLAYQLAYLKADYPLYFYCALLDSVIGDDDKTAEYISECRRRNIRVLYPSINESGNRYQSINQAIRLPICSVKGLGKEAGQTLINERVEHGRFIDFFDFIARITLAGFNRKTIIALVDAGALDQFQENRATLKANLDDAISYGELIRVEKGGAVQINLGLVSKPVMIKMKDSLEERSENEKNALGFCLGPHPVIAERERLGIDFKPLSSLKTYEGPADGFAMIQNVHQHRTRKGDMMAFVKLVDETGDMDMAVMPRLYEKINPDLTKGSYIQFHGKIQNDGSCLADSIRFIRKQNRQN
ncbi:MAG: DNA polymerase III subunit alpha, partial [Erysipelotrichia bacterium]|nr:DNA polymerase III subunit alpha [Erysipelotrichia bacterium]